MNLEIMTFSNELDFGSYINRMEHDSCSFSADMTPSPTGYHAYSISGSKNDISIIEGWMHEYAIGRWISYRFVGEDNDIICIEFL